MNKLNKFLLVASLGCGSFLNAEEVSSVVPSPVVPQIADKTLPDTAKTAASAKVSIDQINPFLSIRVSNWDRVFSAPFWKLLGCDGNVLRKFIDDMIFQKQLNAVDSTYEVSINFGSIGEDLCMFCTFRSLEDKEKRQKLVEVLKNNYDDDEKTKASGSKEEFDSFLGNKVFVKEGRSEIIVFFKSGGLHKGMDESSFGNEKIWNALDKENSFLAVKKSTDDIPVFKISTDLKNFNCDKLVSRLDPETSKFFNFFKDFVDGMLHLFTIAFKQEEIQLTFDMVSSIFKGIKPQDAILPNVVLPENSNLLISYDCGFLKPVLDSMFANGLPYLEKIKDFFFNQAMEEIDAEIGVSEGENKISRAELEKNIRAKIDSNFEICKEIINLALSSVAFSAKSCNGLLASRGEEFIRVVGVDYPEAKELSQLFDFKKIISKFKDLFVNNDFDAETEIAELEKGLDIMKQMKLLGEYKNCKLFQWNNDPSWIKSNALSQKNSEIIKKVLSPDTSFVTLCDGVYLMASSEAELKHQIDSQKAKSASPKNSLAQGEFARIQVDVSSFLKKFLEDKTRFKNYAWPQAGKMSNVSVKLGDSSAVIDMGIQYDAFLLLVKFVEYLITVMPEEQQNPVIDHMVPAKPASKPSLVPVKSVSMNVRRKNISFEGNFEDWILIPVKTSVEYGVMA